ncbi:MAG: DUF1080 domain-containing protein, partial [Planctomycetes bacterium]|nr:DUF1080 domain-containing protein [Planctomycetota bacterium]
PRQPKSAQEGPAEGRLEIRYAPGTRIVECALPWSEIPHVKQLRDAGKSVKFSFRVNHETRGPDMELPIGRSAAEGLSPSFHPNWAPHWPNELEFGFEGPGDEARSALQTDPQGWIDIMPPADLKGWNRVPVPPGGKLGRAQWHVDADRQVLICDGDGGHDMLLTDKEYGDAVFHFEFRYTKIDGGKGYNSGAYVRNSGDGGIWHQAQFGDAAGGFLFGNTMTTDGRKQFFNLNTQVTDNRVKPAGQWNTMEITARGKRLTLWINGAVTCELEDCGVARGHLGLEGEGYRIEFRNLRVKELR